MPRKSKTSVLRDRSAAACLRCRDQKIKCDVVKRGVPCSNCCGRKGAHGCFIPISKKGRKVAQKETVPRACAPCLGLATPLPSQPQSVWSDRIRYSITPSGLRISCEADDSVNTTDKGKDDHFGERQDVDLSLVNAVSIHGDLTATPLHGLQYEKQASSNSVPLPTYVKSPPASMTSTDIEYLWSKGAFAIPHFTFRNELIRSFVEHVYPSLPLLNIHEFISSIEERSRRGEKISLLLLQSIMFAGAAFAKLSQIHEAGYSTRREARKAIFEKARLLYDFDFEEDRISVIQSLLLMTYWNEAPTDGKDEWHWLGVAVSLAHATGLHKNLDNFQLDHKRRGLWKRIWWSCITRDSLLALGMRRPVRIRDGDYEAPMLTLDDFDFQRLKPEGSPLSSECRILELPSLQRDLALMFIAKVELCLCIGDVLCTQYTSRVQNQGVGATSDVYMGPAVHIVPKSVQHDGDVNLCGSELIKWAQNLPEPCKYVAPTAETLEAEGTSLMVERAVLHLIYFLITSTLHRPQAMSLSRSTLDGCNDAKYLARRKVREAAAVITNIIQHLFNLDLTKYLPCTAVTVLLPAITTHLTDIKFTSDQTRAKAAAAASVSMQVLNDLQDNYKPAEAALYFLDSFAAYYGIDLPAESLQQIGDSMNTTHEEAKTGYHGHLTSKTPTKISYDSSSLEKQYTAENTAFETESLGFDGSTTDGSVDGWLISAARDSENEQPGMDFVHAPYFGCYQSSHDNLLSSEVEGGGPRQSCSGLYNSLITGTESQIQNFTEFMNANAEWDGDFMFDLAS